MKYDLIISEKKRTKEEIDNIAKMLKELSRLDDQIFEDIDIK